MDLNLMDQSVLNFLFSVLLMGIGWVLKIFWDSITTLHSKDEERKDQVHALNLLVAGDYVKQDRFDSVTAAINAKLDRIERHLIK